MKNRGTILVLMLLLFVQHLLAWQNPDPKVYEELSAVPYVCVSESQSEDSLNITDEFFNSHAVGVRFRVSKTNLNKGDPFLVDYKTTVLPLVRQTDLVLRKKIIRGAASPEGPISFNRYLARERTRKLVDFIRQADSTIAKKIVCESITEDYGRLLYLMKQSNDPAYARVSALYEKVKHNELAMKKALMARPQLWRRLLTQYFPQLRAAHLILVFGPAPVKPEPEPKPVVKVEPPDSVAIPDSAVAPAPVVTPTVVDTVKEEVVELPEREPRRELLSVKSNLLFDFAYVPGYNRFCPIPNVAIEYYPLHGHFTYGASLDFPWWQHYWKHKYFQIRNYQVHTRYYFRSGDVRKRGIGNGAAFKGAYVSAYAHAGLYCLCFDAHRGWCGEGFGGGLGAGYVVGLGKKQHWRLEFGVQAGFFWTKYDPFQYECPVNPDEQDHLYYYKWTGKASLFKERQYRWTWLGPTRAEITLSYDLLYRRNHKKGFSFRSTEKKGGMK